MGNILKKSKFLIFLLITVIILTVVFYFQNQKTVKIASAQGAIYYASPVGGGNGSASSPFQIKDFMDLPPQPGDKLYLLDGIYIGDNSVINFQDYEYDTTNKCTRYGGGEKDSPVIISALNDGKATIDGQGYRIPVSIRCQKYVTIEGINAHSSSHSVFSVSYSKYTTIKRSIGWDAIDGNANIFGVHYDGPTLLEDVAGFGIARKIFSGSQRGNELTIRRAWGSWDGSHEIGPKMTYTLGYANYNMTVENSIATWTGRLMRESYTLTHGGPNAGCWTSNCPGGHMEYDSNYGMDCCRMDNYGVNQAYGIFAKDGFSGSHRAYTKLLGSIVYSEIEDRVPGVGGIFLIKASDYEVKDSVSFIEHDKAPLYLGIFNAWSSNKGYTNGYCIRANPYNGHFYQTLNSGTSGSSEPNWPTDGGTVTDGSITWKDQGLIILNVTDTTSIGKDNNIYRWNYSNIDSGATINDVSSVFTSDTGARICNRYVDRKLTNEPLWPWPMEQRIYDATLQVRGKGVNITAIIEEMFGVIPEECRNNELCSVVDTNCDRNIDMQDLLNLKDNWGTDQADFNNDSITNTQDLGIMMSAWGNY